MELNPLEIRDFVDRALREDIGPGDITTRALLDGNPSAMGRVVAREGGILAGGPVFLAVFQALDPNATLLHRIEEGRAFAAGDEVLTVRAAAGALLTGERVALNILGRLSGIATLTAEAVRLLTGTPTRVLDTRKTTPGLRFLEKYAVRMGGGRNHRLGLYDAVLVKDNHLALAGGITRAVQRLRERLGPFVPVEVEVETMSELAEALAADVRYILLDNMTPEMLAEAVRLTGGRAVLEASGGFSLPDLPRVGESGVDYVSLGRLTHGARSLDFSLELGWIQRPD